MFSGRFYFIQGALFSCIAPFCSCIALYSVFCVSQHLYIFSNCESARYFIYSGTAIISTLKCEALISWLMSEIFDDIVY